MPVRIHAFLVPLLTSALIAACGGGGTQEPAGSSPTTAAPSQQPTATPQPSGDPTSSPPPVAQAPVGDPAPVESASVASADVPPVAAAPGGGDPVTESAESAEPAEPSHFPNGVAAGDVDQDSVVLWARGAAPGPITFEYGRDENHLSRPEGVVHGQVDNPEVPVKVRVSGLRAGTRYHYRACQGDYCPYPLYTPSPDGREAWGTFKTPHARSAGRKGLTFGVSSCWRADQRPFFGISNAPDAALDFFVALGDTTYADSNQTSDGNGGMERATTLDQFRHKNKIAYTAKDKYDENYFAKLRGSTAIFATIDDHEVVNNFAGGATPDSQRDSCECNGTAPGGKGGCPWEICFSPDIDRQPSYWNEISKAGERWTPNSKRPFINETDLFRSALKAWLEYNPVESLNYDTDIVDVDADRPGRVAGKPKLYRYRTFGKDAAMFLLDTRTFRDEPIGIANDLLPLPFTAFDPRRTMLGSEQLEDFLRDLQDARDKEITWKFVLLSVPIQHLGVFAAPDRFEGYAYERTKILDFIQQLKIENVVFVSGDIHGSIVNNLIYHKTPTHTNDLSLPYYSAAWDISTGPAANPDGFALKSELAMNGLLFGQEYPMIGLEFWNSGAAERAPMIWFPGLNPPPVLLVPGFNQVNRFIPETLKKGRYFAPETNGWTKFEIGTDASRTLTVTTYGVPPDATGEPAPHAIVSQFEVAARGLGGNGEHCLLDRDCVSGRCVLVGGGGLARCEAREPNGSPCIGDGECLSGRCSLGSCKAKEPAGSSCLLNRECISGKCRGILDRTCR